MVEDGLVVAVGDYHALAADLSPEVSATAFPDRLITPGVDTHIHFLQLDDIGGFGEQLLEWLEDQAYPAEDADPARARETAGYFVAELLRNGATCALVSGTPRPRLAPCAIDGARECRGGDANACHSARNFL